MKIVFKALFGDWANCTTAAVAVAVAAAVSRMGDPHLAGWLMPLLLVIGAGYLASRYARG